MEASDEPRKPVQGFSRGEWRPEDAGDDAARARLDAGGAHAGLLGGSPLTLLQGIIPGRYIYTFRPIVFKFIFIACHMDLGLGSPAKPGNPTKKTTIFFPII